MNNIPNVHSRTSSALDHSELKWKHNLQYEMLYNWAYSTEPRQCHVVEKDIDVERIGKGLLHWGCYYRFITHSLICVQRLIYCALGLTIHVYGQIKCKKHNIWRSEEFELHS